LGKNGQLTVEVDAHTVAAPRPGDVEYGFWFGPINEAEAEAKKAEPAEAVSEPPGAPAGRAGQDDRHRAREREEERLRKETAAVIYPTFEEKRELALTALRNQGFAVLDEHFGHDKFDDFDHYSSSFVRGYVGGN